MGIGATAAAMGDARNDAVHARCGGDNDNRRLRRFDQGFRSGCIADVPGLGEVGTGDAEKFRCSTTGHLIGGCLNVGAKHSDNERAAKFFGGRQCFQGRLAGIGVSQ